MKLRCVRGGSGSPFLKGRSYDVAEILEMREHVMVRMPNGDWPKPGNRWFALHPDEWFASPAKGLPALSCGYLYEELNCFGVVIPKSVYGRIPSFKSKLSDALEKVKGLWSLRFRNVRTTCCIPRELEGSFYIVGVEHEELGRAISYADAARKIRRVLSSVGVSDLEATIGDLDLEFWYKIYRPAGALTWRTLRDN